MWGGRGEGVCVCLGGGVMRVCGGEGGGSVCVLGGMRVCGGGGGGGRECACVCVFKGDTGETGQSGW